MNRPIILLVSQVSEKYWIVAAREEIREWERECNMCKRKRRKTTTQIMAPILGIRSRGLCWTFYHCVRTRSAPSKMMAVSTHLLIRSYQHVQSIWSRVAFALDTDSFLNAFTRFANRRGVPKEMVSDCGTNFVRAVNGLKALVNELDQDKIQQSTVHRGVKWNFNPPGAPHFGGIHEAMIKSAKKVTYGVIRASNVTDEEFITSVAGAESLLNSRLLIYQSANLQDIVPRLTPNHFLHGQLDGQFAPETVDTTEFSPRKRWRKVQEIIPRV